MKNLQLIILWLVFASVVNANEVIIPGKSEGANVNELIEYFDDLHEETEHLTNELNSLLEMVNQLKEQGRTAIEIMDRDLGSQMGTLKFGLEAGVYSMRILSLMMEPRYKDTFSGLNQKLEERGNSATGVKLALKKFIHSGRKSKTLDPVILNLLSDVSKKIESLNNTDLELIKSSQGVNTIVEILMVKVLNAFEKEGERSREYKEEASEFLKEETLKRKQMAAVYAELEDVRDEMQATKDRIEFLRANNINTEADLRLYEAAKKGIYFMY